MREKHQLVACPMHPNWDQTCNPGMCPDQGPNPPPFGVQDDSPTDPATPVRAYIPVSHTRDPVVPFPLPPSLLPPYHQAQARQAVHLQWLAPSAVGQRGPAHRGRQELEGVATHWCRPFQWVFSCDSGCHPQLHASISLGTPLIRSYTAHQASLPPFSPLPSGPIQPHLAGG